MSKKTIISASSNKALKLKVLAKKKERVRRKLVVTAKGKESTRRKLVVTAKGKEDVRRKLAITAKQLAVTAKEKEIVRRKLVVTAKEKETVRRKLVVTAENLSLKAKQLAETTAKDGALLESIGDGVIATDQKGKVILINKIAENLLGFTSAEILGKFFDHAILMLDAEGKQIPEKARPLILALNSGKTTTTSTTTTTTTKEKKKQTIPETKTTPGIYYYLRKDKTKFPIALTVSPVILENKLIGAIMVFHDITKEKEIDRAKSEFISLASHQLRTPLTTVSWYSEMLLAGDAGKLSPDQTKYMEEIYQGNKRMIELVNTLLNVSRLELGTSLVEPKPTDIIALAQSVVTELKLKIEAKKMIVTQKFSKDIPIISVDPKLLRMVFQNLLTNAINYTPEAGKIVIEITLSNEKSTILIKVTDTGYGIPKNQQDKIFTKLFRADNARDKDTGGTGLGLYIVKSIIEDSAGKIWFESEENKGTTFFVTLPLAGMKKKEGTKALS